MGRYYKTSTPTYVQDTIYTPPFEAMQKAIEMKDAQYEKNLAEGLALDDILKAEALTIGGDKEKADAIIEGYRAERDGIVEIANQDPDKFLQNAPILKDLTRRVKQDFSEGALSIYAGNKKQSDTFYAKLEEDMRKQGKNATFIQSQIDAIRSHQDKKYVQQGGANYTGKNTYKRYNTEELHEYVDPVALTHDLAKDYKTNVIGRKHVYLNGVHKIMDGNTVNTVETKRLQAGLAAGLAAHQKWQDYSTQYGRLIGDEKYKENMEKLATGSAVSAFGFTSDIRDQDITTDSASLEMFKMRQEAIQKEKEKVLASFGVRSISDSDETAKFKFDQSQETLAKLGEKIFGKEETAKLLKEGGDALLYNLSEQVTHEKLDKKSQYIVSQIYEERKSPMTSHGNGTLADLYVKGGMSKSQASAQVLGVVSKTINDVATSPAILLGSKLKGFSIDNNKYAKRDKATVNDLFQNPLKYGLRKDSFYKEGVSVNEELGTTTKGGLVPSFAKDYKNFIDFNSLVVIPNSNNIRDMSKAEIAVTIETNFGKRVTVHMPFSSFNSVVKDIDKLQNVNQGTNYKKP